MSREILFRGRRIDNGEWIEGDLIHPAKDFAKWMIIKCIDGSMTEKVDPSTVCQYTGFTDEKGKKIFEGDIIQNSNSRYVIVYYDDTATFIRAKIDSNTTVYLSQFSMRNEFEVVGNRWDTPELLEGGTGE